MACLWFFLITLLLWNIRIFWRWRWKMTNYWNTDILNSKGFTSLVTNDFEKQYLTCTFMWIQLSVFNESKYIRWIYCYINDISLYHSTRKRFDYGIPHSHVIHVQVRCYFPYDIYLSEALFYHLLHPPFSIFYPYILFHIPKYTSF